MKAVSLSPSDIQPSDADYLDLVSGAINAGGQDSLRAILAAADDHATLWSSEPGQEALAVALGLLLDALAEGRATDAIETIKACPPGFTQSAHDLLLLAFFPDGHVGPLAQLDDAALLCLALLTHRLGRRTRANDLIGQLEQRPLHVDMAQTVANVRAWFATAARTRFKAKLVIWSLESAIQQGALIRALNERGIASAICTPSDVVSARAIIQAADLADEIVFPRFAARDMGDAARQLIADMLLEPVNVLFVDGDAQRLHDVAATLPAIRTESADSDACNALLQRIIDENREIGRARLADYRILEARVADRQALSDADFLMQSGIRATYTHRMDNLAFVERIEDLINRADPLNYTETRVVPGSLRELVMNVTDYDVFSAFIWDKYGHHGLDGLVGVVVYDRRTRQPLHLAFSCRIMHMGVEDFLIKALTERYGAIDLSALAKPLPAQTSAAITYVPFEDVREQILASQAPQDWSKIRMRIMSDCMSGAFHHYSRFKDEIDFDNIPRVFALASMVTGAWREQRFPDRLVYNVAIDYMDWRWKDVFDDIDPAVYARALDAFCEMVVSSGCKALLFLPPNEADLSKYAVLPNISAADLRARDGAFNALWRAAAARHPAHLTIVDLGDFIGEADMVGHAYHYTPSAMKRMTEIIDDWYATA
ncbi:MAG TPA: hypothetical protein VGE65_08380 [Sphingobium sp.]